MKTRPGSLLGGPTHLKRQNQSRYIRGDQAVASDRSTLELNGNFLMNAGHPHPAGESRPSNLLRLSAYFASGGLALETAEMHISL